MHQIIRFGLKMAALLLPFSLLVAVYFIYDPYMVIHQYKRFDRTHVMLNEAYVGWQSYMANRDSLKYNSFIMGNSCTMAFRTEVWEKHLAKNDRAVRIFDTGESLGGLCQKLHSLDSVHAPIKNLLIIANLSLLKDAYPSQENGHLYSASASGISTVAFQMSFLQKFLDPNIALPYIDYLVRGRFASYMRGVINPGPPIREPYTNNFINPREQEIRELGELYWTKHRKEFRERKEAGKEEPRAIFREQEKLLKQLRSICTKHGTSVRLILEPDYCQKRINHTDVAILKHMLGDSSVFDFSGINRYTSDLHSYYEPGHFRITVGASILEQIYDHRKP